MEFYENSQSPERALLIGVDTGEYNAEISMEELALLSETAGAEIIGTVIQKLEAPSPATYIGSGRMSEVAAFCRNNDIDLIIADSELTPSQINNIETKTDTRVVDRTMLILDILPQGQGRARVNCRWSWHSLNIRFRFVGQRQEYVASRRRNRHKRSGREQARER